MQRASLTSRVVRSPFSREVYSAGEIRGMIDARDGCDHGPLSNLENAIAAPVLFTYEQHYRLLASLVDAFEDAVGHRSCVFIRASRFYPTRAPARLLRPGIAFLDDPLSAALRSEEILGAPSLVISDWLRHSPIEWRDNRLWLDVVGVRGGRDLLRALVERARLTDCLVDVTFEAEARAGT